MKSLSLLCVILLCLLSSCNGCSWFFEPEMQSALRAPAYPLITIDPYTSAWSFSDKLNEDVVRHWTGKKQPLLGVLRVDGETYRFMGVEEEAEKAVFTKAAVQKSATVMPTATYYTFDCGPVQLDLVFTSPLLMDDLDLMSTPINYISYQVKASDGKQHDVQMYIEASSLWAVNTEDQAVDCTKEVQNGISYLKAGTKDQNILGRKGDDVRIDWGYFYLAAAEDPATNMATGKYYCLKQSFADNGEIVVPAGQNREAAPVAMGYCRNMGKIDAAASGFLMVGYDDIQSIQYFGENRQAYWKHNGKVDIYQAFEKANAGYETVMKRCRAFDASLMNDAIDAGGKQYAELCALAYRQAVAAHKLVTDKKGNLLFLPKENSSNGSIGTVDVAYPSSPLFLLYNPELLKGMLNPIFYYSESGQWDKPFAAHDVGTYPLANGQTFGGEMPVEESGNMLILTAAIALAEGNATYAAKHWTVLTTWADFLLSEGLDPGYQSCTDDFAGHYAHNANLSIKAIMGIAGYGKLAEMMGEQELADKYIAAARDMARKWQSMADAGSHTRLTFDQPNSWSLKYNLIWDKFLGLSLFQKKVADKEIDFYLTRLQTYGLPLDCRRTYTKSDWILWSACLTDDADKFRQLVAPVYKYVDETTTRMPISDWYETTNGESVGFRARSVVGAFFMKMLEQKMGKPREAEDGKTTGLPVMQKSELFATLPDYCPTPDGMAIAPDGELVLACPNFADLSKPACLVRITKEGEISKWLDVPVLPETGRAAPMGIAFAENGDLYICDNQGWSGNEKARNKGRLLRLRFTNRELCETVVVASGMEHPNGVRIYNGKVYVTQSALSKIKDESGLLVSGVYSFNLDDRNIRVTNTRADKNLITTVVTRNPDVQYGLDGLVFDKEGNLYVGNFGDGVIHRLVIDYNGKVADNEIWAQDASQLRTTDGMCMDDEGNIWVADFSENAIACVYPNGTIRRMARNQDCDGSNGCLDQPGEPIVWNGRLIISCFDMVTGPDKANTRHDKPFTLAALPLH